MNHQSQKIEKNSHLLDELKNFVQKNDKFQDKIQDNINFDLS